MSRAAIRYAKAILSTATDKNVAEAVGDDMQDIIITVQQSKDLYHFINSEVISLNDKKEALKEVFKATNPITLNLIDLLAENKRINLLPNIALQYKNSYNTSRGIQKAFVTTAIPLTDDLKLKVLERAKALTTASKIEIENIIDESILGGFILRVADKQYDASIANQLNTLKRQITT